MPTYEYVCKNCGDRFEKFQSFSARPLKTHDACGGEVQKVFHASGVVFKGPGFYATDSRPAARTSGDGGSDNGSSKESTTANGSNQANGSKSSTSSSTTSSAAAD
ncbi:MAG: FmdB family zinc ribbon protein [Acidimicrobiia bacterium]|nr:FmdB family zinc ribbon protein [Acidimicrobiia bacterium]